jgi:hypothetical protein
MTDVIAEPLTAGAENAALEGAGSAAAGAVAKGVKKLSPVGEYIAKKAGGAWGQGQGRRY